jgi:hypothetical protein
MFKAKQTVCPDVYHAAEVTDNPCWFEHPDLMSSDVEYENISWMPGA